MSTQKKLNLPPKVIRQTLYSFYDQLELPDWINYYHPNGAVALAEIHERKLVPSSANNSFYKENAMVLDQAEYLLQRLSHFDQINIFEVFEVSGISSLPFTFNLLESNQLSKYVPVTATSAHNHYAINKFKECTILHPNQQKVSYDSIVANVEASDFSVQVVDVVRSDPRERAKSTNLFLLMNSYLGNSLYPNRILKNIYDSMTSGDYLIISQGIYADGIEDLLINDYSNILSKPGVMVSEKELAHYFSDDANLDVIWDDSEENPGVKIGIKTQKNSDFYGAEVQEGDFVKIFRSQRFIESNLKKMLHKTGLRLLNVTYSDEMDNAIFFAIK